MLKCTQRVHFRGSVLDSTVLDRTKIKTVVVHMSLNLSLREIDNGVDREEKRIDESEILLDKIQLKVNIACDRTVLYPARGVLMSHGLKWRNEKMEGLS